MPAMNGASNLYSSEEHTWFIPGYAISRQIMFSQIQLYLGQCATVRPFTYRGREGYLVTAPGQGLTMSQIEDLKSLSRQYEEHLANKMVGEPSINAPVEFSARGSSTGSGSSSSSSHGSYGSSYYSSDYGSSGSYHDRGKGRRH